MPILGVSLAVRSIPENKHNEKGKHMGKKEVPSSICLTLGNVPAHSRRARPGGQAPRNQVMGFRL